MIKSFIYYYFWFWKESFSFMEGYNRAYIAWGCFTQAPKFALEMVRWDKLTPQQKEIAYANRYF